MGFTLSTARSRPSRTGPLPIFLARQGDAYGMVAAPLLLDRLSLKPGDRLLIGNATLVVNGRIESEPDAVSEGFGFAPRIMVSEQALAASGLIDTGSLVEHVYKIRLKADAPPLAAIEDQAKRDFPDAGWSIRTAERAAPNLTENIRRFSQFLTLVGLTALIVGGVALPMRCAPFLDSKRTVIATLKCLGAPASVVVLVYLFQILLVSGIGIALGLMLGMVAPWIAGYYLAQYLPITADFALYPAPCAGDPVRSHDDAGLRRHAAWPFPGGSSHRAVPRSGGSRCASCLSWPYVGTAALAIAALAALAVATAYDRRLALIFLVAMAGSFVVLRLVAYGVAALARRSPRVSSPALRLAVGNIHRPGALTPSVILSLGLGLALLVTLSLIDGNLRRSLTGTLSEKAPNFFFVDIQRSQLEDFRALIGREARAAR